MKKLTLWLGILNVISMLSGFALLSYTNNHYFEEDIRDYTESIGLNCLAAWCILTVLLLGAIIHQFVLSSRTDKLIKEKQENLNQIVKNMEEFSEFCSKPFQIDMLWRYFHNYATREDSFYNARMFFCGPNKQSFVSFTMCQVGEVIILGLPYGTKYSRINKSIDLPEKITLGQFKEFMKCYGFQLEWIHEVKETYGLSQDLKTIAKI
jgi:hypothetical protein